MYYKKNTLCVLQLLFLTTALFTSLRSHATIQSSGIHEQLRSYSVGLGATRIIYGEKSKGAIVSVNNPNDYPVLVQSKVSQENNATPTPFVVTPPLFRLEAHQQSQVKIIMTREPQFKDKESLYWFCAKGIPPVKGDAWATSNEEDNKTTAAINVNVSLSQCIKLIVRPDALMDNSEDIVKRLAWSNEGGKLKITNPTSFYMNMNTVNLNGITLKDINLISPMSSKTFNHYDVVSGSKITWSIINDIGGISGPFETIIK